MGYFLLHDIFPKLGPSAGLLFLLGLIGAFGTAALWVSSRSARRRGSSPPRLPPTARFLGISALVSTVVVSMYWSVTLDNSSALGYAAEVYVWNGFLFAWPFAFLFPEAVAAWIGDTIQWAGVMTTIWWMTWPLRHFIPAPKPRPPEPEIILDSEKRSEQDACDQCRAAMALPVTEEPMARIAHTSDGPRFLYRCRACHSYWLKERSGPRVISVVRARQLFPDAIT